MRTTWLPHAAATATTAMRPHPPFGSGAHPIRPPRARATDLPARERTPEGHADTGRPGEGEWNG
jgi:hypothetical protein